MNGVRQTGTADTVRWLRPAPLWTTNDFTDAGNIFAQPFLAELRDDSFLDSFLAIVGGTGGHSPWELPDTQPDSDNTGAWLLYAATSHRYYLILVSLVCDRPGVPDHALRSNLGERVFFILRRLTEDGSEEAFVTDGAPGRWQAAGPDALTPGELELPLHKTPVAGFASPSDAAAILGMAEGQRSTRSIWYGHVPTNDSEPDRRYLIRAVLSRPCGPTLSTQTEALRFAGPLRSGPADAAKGPIP